MKARRIVTLAAVASLTGCAGARSGLVAPRAEYPVSLSSTTRNSRGELVDAKTAQVVGAFRHTQTIWGILYGHLPLSGDVDLSEPVNQQVASAGGDAVTSVEVHVSECTFPNHLPTLLLAILPFWPGCAAVEVTGEILKVEPGPGPTAATP